MCIGDAKTTKVARVNVCLPRSTLFHGDNGGRLHVRLDESLTGRAYVNFSNDESRELSEEIPSRVLGRVWFMHDGAPPHFNRTVHERMDDFPTNGRLAQDLSSDPLVS